MGIHTIFLPLDVENPWISWKLERGFVGVDTREAQAIGRVVLTSDGSLSVQGVTAAGGDEAVGVCTVNMLE